MQEIITFGWISLIPVLIVIITALKTKKAAESLLLGTIIAAIIVTIYQGPGGFANVSYWWNLWFDKLLEQIGASAVYIIMFGMFGAIIRLLDESGAALGFSEIGAKVANSRKKALMLTWFVSLFIFLSDFLHALSISVAMRSLMDKWKVSREFFAYIVNSLGAGLCILVPISSWGVMYSSQTEALHLFGNLTGFEVYARAVPFMFYAWAGILVVPLFILGVIPLYGPMKAAENRALTTGKVYPEWYYTDGGADLLDTEVKPSSALNFLIPIAVLIAVAIITRNITLATIVTVVVLCIMLGFQKIFTFEELINKVIQGFKDMLYVTILIIAAFLLQDMNDLLGLTPYVISIVTPFLSPALLPAMSFIVVALLCFGTGSFWGIAMISFPIIMPLAVAMDVNLYLTIAAIATATAFGSQACFYSDSVTVVAAATGIKNMDYARNALPLIAIPVIIAIIGNLVFGMIL